MAAVQRLMAALIIALLLLPACGKNAVLQGDADSANDTVEIEDQSIPDEGGEDPVDQDSHDGDRDDGPAEVINDIPDEEDGPFVCETDRYLPADNIFEPGWWGPEFVFEIPTGYAWVSSLPDLSLWRLVTAPSTFDAIDISVILEGLPAATPDGGTVPAVDVNAVYSAESGLALLLLGYSLGGSSLDTYGALYDMDGHARVPQTVLSASAGHDIDRLAATDGGGFAYLFCAYSAETYCYACEIGRIDESGIVSSPSDVEFSFGTGNAFWNNGEFVFVAYEGCGYEGRLLWRSVALDGSVTREVDLGYYGADLEVHPGRVAVGDSDVGICINHVPGRWGHVHAISFMRTDRSGNLLLEPVRVFESSEQILNLSMAYEKDRGYGVVLSEFTSEDAARVVFLRFDFEGTIRQETILDEVYDPLWLSAGPLFWREDHFVAGWGSYNMGSLVCR
jgi:hypothetical protein